MFSAVVSPSGINDDEDSYSGDWSIISSTSPSPDNPDVLCTWVDSLGLTKADRRVLVDGSWLSANHISAANMLLKKSFPSQNRLQDTCYLDYKSQWNSKPEDFVQILYINKNHWVCVSNKFSGSSVDLYDSLHAHESKS